MNSGRHRSPPAERGYLASVRSTAATSLAMAAVSAGMGVLLARYLGPAGRGAYAVVTSYALAAATVGECGLTAAICYFVARTSARRADVVRTGGTLLFLLGVVVGLAGWAAAPLVFPAGGNARTAFRIVFLAQPLIFVSACWVFALQATRLAAWNLVRAVQPVAQAAAVLILVVVGGLTVTGAVGCLLGSIVLQTALAAAWWRRDTAGPGRIRRDTGVELFRYGGTVFLSAVPYLLNAHLDLLILGVLVEPEQVGLYAVAVSMSLLSQPVCAAFGNVAMPRLARLSGRPDLAAGAAVPPIALPGPAARRVALAAVGASLAFGVLVCVVMCAVAPLLLPVLLGARYEPSVTLLWLLAPGAALLGCNRSMDDVLRGLDRSMTVARREVVGTVVTIVGLAVLVPTIGVRGAAIASSAAYTVSFLLLLRAVLRAVDVSARSVPGRLRVLAATGGPAVRARWSTAPAGAHAGSAPGAAGADRLPTKVEKS